MKFEYDKLLIATGARAIIPSIPGADLAGVMGLKSLQDGRRIKNYLATHEVKTALIIGMGYLGLEMTEALTARGVKVEMLKVRQRLLPWMPEEMAEVVRNELRAKGVGLHFGTNVTGIERAGRGLKATMANDTEIVADMVIFMVPV